MTGDNDADKDNGNDDKDPKPGKSDANGSGGSEKAAEFTQDQLDAVAEKERKRGVSKGQADLLSELGLDSIDDLKKSITDLADLRKSQMSDSEKKDAELELLKKQIEDEKKTSQATKDAANQRLMRAAVMTEAAKAEHNIHEQARPDVWAFVDREGLSVTDAGEVEGVEEAVKAVVEAKPYLVSDGQQQKPPGTPKREPTKKQQDPADNSGRRRSTVRL